MGIKQEPIMKAYSLSRRPLLSSVGFFIYFSSTLTASGASLNISQQPLMLVDSVAPNLIFSIDDSGSMKRSHVPDSIAADSTMRTKRAKSADFNPIYYNPNATYLVPKGISVDGTDQIYSTSFTEARHMGFKSSLGAINLSNSYRVTWYCTEDSADNCNYDDFGFSTIRELAENPQEDFYVQVTVTTSTPNASKTTPGGITYKINRTTTGTNCTASANWNGINFSNVPCSRSSNTATVDMRKRSVPAYYYVFEPTLSGCSASDARNNDACYRLRLVTADEQQNFAIWYSFYRDRALATQSAAHLAFYDLSPAVRFTWQSLNNCSIFTSSSTNNACSDNRFRIFTNRHKSNFLTWLTNINFSGGTPLRTTLDRAGKFLQGDTAWALTPNPYTATGSTGTTVQNPMYSCRPSFHIMMTDGMWNGNNGNPSTTLRPDHNTFTLPDNTRYTNTRRPYADTTTNTLADLAMHYWATDLSNLSNDIKPYVRVKNNDSSSEYWDARNNPATWQHMTNYMVGLGLGEALNNVNVPWKDDTFAGGYLNILNGTANWPAASDGHANNVYDLWHAAINSRGEFFSADSPEAMVQAFRDILNRIADRTSTAARPAVSASFVSDSDGNNLQSNVYATQFSSEDWSGQLTKTLVNANDQTTELWNIQTANQSLDPLTRRVMMAAPSNKSTGLKDFTWANLGTLQSLLNIDPDSLVAAQDNRGEQRVAYILGERSGEGDATPKFRKRNNRTVMGDIINSSPAVVGTPAYLAYLADAIENPLGNRASYKSYAAFRETYQKSSVNNPDGRPEMIYVGGNDGMLHGFNAATGREEFAFIPTEVIKNLYRLTGQNYSGAGHRYFVDGSPIVRDVYFGDDEGWRTVLIGTLRAGGKSLFALDVTDPTQIKLLWEFDSAKDADLGFTFAQPEIVRLHTGEWAVLQGNGYNSTNDKAALLIINIKSGELIKKITVPDVVEGNITLPNGLSSVRGADNNGDGLVDYAYAGDLQGNLWRFDLVKTTNNIASITGDPFARANTEVTSTSKADFKLAYGDKPLFVARDTAGKRQAITIQPSLVRHPTSYGYLVLFGTGKYLETSDANVDTSRAMTLYGIWDRNTKRQSTTKDTPVAGTRAGRLLEQSFTAQQNSVVIGDEQQSATRDIRLVSQEPAQWFRAPTSSDVDVKIPESDTLVTQWGWALDMAVKSSNGTPTLEGEMIINNMTASGSILFLSSLTPNQDPCQAGADTWLYAVDAFTGGRTRFNVLDLNADRLVNPTDQYNANVVSGMRFPALGGFTLAPGNKVFGSDGAADPATVGDDPNSSGRQSWHIVPEEFQ